MQTIKLFIDDLPRDGERALQCRAYLYKGDKLVGRTEVYTDNIPVFIALAPIALRNFVKFTIGLCPETEFEVQFSYEACQHYQKTTSRMEGKRLLEREVMNAALFHAAA